MLPILYETTIMMIIHRSIIQQVWQNILYTDNIDKLWKNEKFQVIVPCTVSGAWLPHLIKGFIFNQASTQLGQVEPEHHFIAEL